MKVTNFFNLVNNQNDYLKQEDVNFLNVELGVDNPFFLDFNNIMSSNTPYGSQMRIMLDSYSFQIGSLLLTDRAALKKFLSNLHETNSTYIGWSNGSPDGNSIGPILCESLIKALTDYKKIFTSGKFNFNTLQFTVKQIASDRVSDIITSVCKSVLVQFTIDECNTHGIPRTKSCVVKMYDHHSNQWVNKMVLLPSVDGEPLILLPKDLVTSGGHYNYSLNRLMTLGINNLANIYSEFITMQKQGVKSKLTKKAMKKFFRQKGYDDKDIVRLIFDELSLDLVDKILADINSKNYNLTDLEIENIISRKIEKTA